MNTHASNTTQLCQLFNWYSAGVLRTSNSLCRKVMTLKNNLK